MKIHKTVKMKAFSKSPSSLNQRLDFFSFSLPCMISRTFMFIYLLGFGMFPFFLSFPPKVEDLKAKQHQGVFLDLFRSRNIAIMTFMSLLLW